jgi:hypothetical protein
MTIPSNATSSLRTYFSDHFRGLAEKHDVFSQAISKNTTLLTNSFLQLYDKQSFLQREVATLREVASNAGFKRDNLDSNTAAIIILFLAICSVDVMYRSLHTALLLAAVCALLHSSSRQNTSRAPHVGWSELNGVVLMDALDRRLLLPLELCASYQVMLPGISLLYRYAYLRLGISYQHCQYFFRLTRKLVYSISCLQHQRCQHVVFSRF